MRRLTIRAATILAVVLIGSLFILLSWGAGSYFREAALQSQVKSLSRIIEVASTHALDEIRQQAINLQAVLNNDNHLTTAFAQFQQGRKKPLLKLLDDPLVNGFPGTSDVNLVKVRIFDMQFNFLAESSHGIQGLPPQLPEFLYNRALLRIGVDRLKAIGGLWVSPRGPVYSMLLPIGGLRLEGYIELLFDPMISLTHVGEIASLPLSISPADKPAKLATDTLEQSGMLPIEYLLHGDDGKPAYRLIGLEDVRQLYQDMSDNQFTTTIAFISSTFAVLILLMLMLNRAVFKPLKQILLGITQYREGLLDSRIRPSGLRELFTLGKTFNSMIEHIQHDMDELERHSQIDGLTGLSNRSYFEQRLHEEWSRASRLKRPMAILFIDIDHFKRYNDHYGHLQGDDCLRRISEAIRTAVKRDIDIAARYGGEEFIIMLPETGLEGAEKVAAELQQAIRELHIEHLGSNIKPFVTLSIGIACQIAQFPDSPEQLLNAADQALYRAKEGGRNRIGTAASA